MIDRKIITGEELTRFVAEWFAINTNPFSEKELTVNSFFDSLEPAPRPRQEIIDYIKAITHQPCSCTHCQVRKQILLWAFPGIEKEVEK